MTNGDFVTGKISDKNINKIVRENDFILSHLRYINIGII